MAHGVRATFLGDTHRLKLYVATMTMSNVGTTCDTAFQTLATAQIHVVKALRSGTCFVNGLDPRGLVNG